MRRDNNSSLVKWFKNLRKKSREIKKGDVGVYHDILSLRTLTEEQQPLHCDFYVKVVAVNVFEDLIEIEIQDIKTIDSTNQEVVALIKSMIPKYLKPKYINWIIND